MEETGLLQQLGINWKLFLSQAVNFFILLIILRQFVYKPLLKIIKERNNRIKEGLEKAAAADIRLQEVETIAKGKIKEAENKSVSMIEAAKQNAKALEQMLGRKAEQKQEELIKQIQAGYERQKEEASQKVLAEAGALLKKFIVKAVELKPDAIDDKLIEKASLKVNES